MSRISAFVRLANISPLAASLASFFALSGAAFAVLIAPAAAGAVDAAVSQAPNADFVAYIDRAGSFYSRGSYGTFAKTPAGDVRS